ncbi:sirohydrochlorin chelatase [Desulforamulus putei]|uniref:CbiX protein n=1 Tax=Desulforamulus putei DSM 12395 TaxID=1121429 RepID=A0A1M4TXT7_9FIRM|nr:CbiX/SirB N-terminal domain-containing protein [Desulforamulus putei]SHE49265.1 CbiX protein [Desulforamulus putei DSM 12395]
MQEGIIILGHGSRLPEANQEVFEITEQVKAAGREALYETCFLQFGEPDLPRAIEKMNRAGVKKITVIPLLLVVGSHIQADLPALLRQQKKLYPHITFVLAPHLGADRRIAEIVIDRMEQGSEI